MTDLPNDGDLNWGEPLRAYMEGALSTASTASSTATLAKTTADAALELAETSVAPADTAVAAFVNNPASDTGMSLAAMYQQGNAFVDIRRFGATTSGDATTAIQAAITAAVGRAVFVPAGTWTCASALVLPSNSTLLLAPGATLRMTQTTGNCIRFEGTEAAGVALTANTVVGERTVSAPGHGLVAGDLFRLGSNQVFDASSTSSTIGELLYVESVAGTVITTTVPIVGGPYTTVGGATVSKITPLKNVRITGQGTIEGNKVAESNQIGIYGRLTTKVRIDGITTKNFDQRHMAFRDCLDGKIFFCDIDWAIHTSQAYGVSLIDATADFEVMHNQFNNLRHATSTNNSTGGRGIPRRHRIAFNKTNWSSTALGGSMAGGDAIDTHTAAEDIWIEHNTVIGSSGQGINFECRSGRVVGNLVVGSTSNGIAVHNESDFNGSIEVTGNSVVNPGGHGISVYPATRGASSYYEDVLIAGNKVRGVTGSSTAYNYGSSVTPATLDRNVRMVNNVATRCSGAYIYLVRNAQDLEWSGNQWNLSSGAVAVTDGGAVPGWVAQQIISDAAPVTPSTRILSLSPETGTTDSLMNISGGRRGQEVLLRSASVTTTITLPVTGNLRLASGTTFSLTGNASISFYWNGSFWVETNRSA